jgi:hypothetical protein
VEALKGRSGKVENGGGAALEPEEDPVIGLLLSGAARTLHEAEELYLDNCLPELIAVARRRDRLLVFAFFAFFFDLGPTLRR